MSKNSKIDLVKCGLAAILLKAKLFNGVNVFRKLNCSKEILAIILTGGMLLAPSFFDLRGQQIEMDLAGDNLAEPSQIELTNKLPIFQNNTLLPLSNSLPFSSSGDQPAKIVWRIKMISTGYSSTIDQTDDTPLITASGKQVREGIVAANFVPLGTEIRLPELYGDRIFVVEDRMHPRKYYQVDIWFSSHQEALNFGVKTTIVEVLGN